MRTTHDLERIVCAQSSCLQSRSSLFHIACDVNGRHSSTRAQFRLSDGSPRINHFVKDVYQETDCTYHWYINARIRPRYPGVLEYVAVKKHDRRKFCPLKGRLAIHPHVTPWPDSALSRTALRAGLGAPNIRTGARGAAHLVLGNTGPGRVQLRFDLCQLHLEAREGLGGGASGWGPWV